MIKKGISSLVALATGLAMATTSTSALAAVGDPGSPQVVEYIAGGTLLIQLPGAINYVGQLNAGTGCANFNQTVDTLKAWQSLGQAALLSGKKLLIYSTVCGGKNHMTAVDLRQ